MQKTASDHRPLSHGAARLPEIEVRDYNVELRDDEGFVGDRVL